MELSLNIIGEIIKRAPHEPPVFIAQFLDISEYHVLKIIKKYNIKKLPLDERVESIEYLAYYNNIDLEYLKLSVNLLQKYKKPLPSEFTDGLVQKLRKQYGTSLSNSTWKFITDRVTLEELDYILKNYYKFTDKTILRDLELENTEGLMPRIKSAYSLTKPEREDLYCEVCRINHLPPKNYKSNTSCKKCWSKRMSEYQYIYYPTKMSNNE